MTWFLAALSVPIINAVSSFIDKYLVEKRVPDPYVLIFWSGWFSVCIGVPLWWYTGFQLPDASHLVSLVGVGMLSQVGYIFWYMALMRDEVSRLTPLGALFPVASYLFAWLILGETIPAGAFVGFVFLVIAGFVVSVVGSTQGVFRVRPALWYMLGFIVLLSLPRVVFKAAEVGVGFAPAFALQTIGSALGAVIVLFGRRIYVRAPIRFRLPVGTLATLFVNDALFASGFAIGMYAVTIGPVSLTSAVSNIQPFAVLAIGWCLTMWAPHIIEEDISHTSMKQKIVGALCATVGALIVGLYAR